jgi:hypothetical protein
MTEQRVMIDLFGRPVSAYTDTNPIDLSKMGRQSIVRFSEVLFDETLQLFYVEYRDSAPARYRGKRLTFGQYFAATETAPPGEAASTRVRGWAGVNAMSAALFPTYKDAIYGEQAVLALMMNEGIL